MTIQELYDRVGGSYQHAVGIMKKDKLIDKYVCRFPDSDLLDRVNAASENLDATALFESTHALKGVCGNLGLDGLAEMASELADEFRPSSTRRFSDGEVREKLDALKARYQSTVDGIRAYMQDKT